MKSVTNAIFLFLNFILFLSKEKPLILNEAAEYKSMNRPRLEQTMARIMQI